MICEGTHIIPQNPQIAMIPSHDLVVVRLGHYKGSTAGGKALDKAYSLLMQAVPEKKQ